MKRDRSGTLHFADYPEFTPNLTPREIFEMGSFGGTYWRPIHSSVVNKDLKNIHLRYKSLRGLPAKLMTTPWDLYDKSINKYGVHVGTTLEFWEAQSWITKYHPYGWVHWLSNKC